METILDCAVAGCVTGCPACVLAGDLTEDEASSLDRQGALQVVRALAANSAPPAEDAAVPGARLTADVLDCIVRARAPDARRLVLRAEPPLDVSSFGSWRAAKVAKRWADTGRQVVISVAPGALAGLDRTGLPALRDWLSSWGAVLEEAPDAKLPNGAKVLAEVVSGHGALVLATRDPAVFSVDARASRVATARQSRPLA